VADSDLHFTTDRRILFTISILSSWGIADASSIRILSATGVAANNELVQFSEMRPHHRKCTTEQKSK